MTAEGDEERAPQERIEALTARFKATFWRAYLKGLGERRPWNSIMYDRYRATLELLAAASGLRKPPNGPEGELPAL
jgi:hypothetical protein